jgi:Domain of unknown function (DUF4157)
MPASPLSRLERSSLGNLSSLVNCDCIRLYRSDATGWSQKLRRIVLLVSRNRAVALGNRVFLPNHAEGDLATLAHELTHCAQFQAWGSLRYFGRGLLAQLRDLGWRACGIGSSPYRYVAEPGKEFSEYGMEQQGQIVEDCFRGQPAARAISPFQPGPPA